jgi:hypothetical protein
MLASLTNTSTTGGVVLPSPISGGFILSKMYLYEQNVDIRALLPGVWFCPHNRINFSDKEVVVGQGELTGRTFIVLFATITNAVWFETSDTWYG